MPQPPLTLSLAIVIHPELMPGGDLQPILQLLADFSPVLEEMGEEMASEQRDNFAEKGSTFNYPWVPNKPETDLAKARAGYGNEQMIRTGALLNEIGNAIYLNPDSVSSGIDLASGVGYAAAHQDGAPKVNLPQRILVAVTQDMVSHLMEILQDYLSAINQAAPGALEIVSSYG